jgi:hypothetical protein
MSDLATIDDIFFVEDFNGVNVSRRFVTCSDNFTKRTASDHCQKIEIINGNFFQSFLLCFLSDGILHNSKEEFFCKTQSTHSQFIHQLIDLYFLFCLKIQMHSNLIGKTMERVVVFVFCDSTSTTRPETISTRR